jgi:hypothetical protein
MPSLADPIGSVPPAVYATIWAVLPTALCPFAFAFASAFAFAVAFAFPLSFAFALAFAAGIVG